MSIHALFAVVFLAICGYVCSQSTELPRCRQEIIGNMAKYYADGLPLDLTSQMLKCGPISYLKLSAVNAQALRTEQAVCVGFKFLDRQTAVLTKRMQVGSLVTRYSVEEKIAMFVYKTYTDTKSTKRMYVLHADNCVFLTYRCDKMGTGDDHHVGIAVGDMSWNNLATQDSYKEAEKKLEGLNLKNNNLVDLKCCSCF